MKKTLLSIAAILLTLGLSGCVPKPATEEPIETFSFDKNGVSFTVPMSWEITQEQKHEGEGGVAHNIVVANKEENTGSGVVTLIWTEIESEPEDDIALFQEKLEESFAEYSASIAFEENISQKFGEFTTLSSTYTTTLLGEPMEGTVYAFTCGKYTVSAAIQNSIKDAGAHAQGFAMFQDSLVCDESEEVQE